MRKKREAQSAPAAIAGTADVLDVEGLFAGFQSTAMIRVLAELVRLARDPEVPVLIEGESGTGKTLVAQYVHALSPRSAGPFQHVLVAALDDGLASSELFGHVAGAFTDARRDRAGYFATAHRGTLFLDEVGKASLAVQRKLLHAIEHGEICPIGSDQIIRVDTRIVAASNIALADLVRTGAFLPDLYARLETFRIRLPALRERRADIPLLIKRCVAAHSQAVGLAEVPAIHESLMGAMQSAPWPNNVRQLSATVRRLLLDARGESLITVAHCTDSLEWLADIVRPEGPLTRGRVARAMAECDNNASRAARMLGVNRSTLYRARDRRTPV